MTTATRQDARRSAVSPMVATVAWSAAAALGIGLAISGIGAVVSGAPAGLAALIGTTAVVGVLFSGALIVTLVVDVKPAASLLVALVTYISQMALLAVVLIPLGRTSWADQHLDAAWLAAAVIGGALVWTVSQVVLATRVRIPVYDLAPSQESRVSGTTAVSER